MPSQAEKEQVVALSNVEGVYRAILSSLKSEQARINLENTHAICRGLVVDVKIKPTVSIVVKHLAANYPGQYPKEQTIRNRRNGSRNPYKSLIEAWQVAAEVIALPKRKIERSAEWDIGDGDVLAIQDPALRHKVLLLWNQNRSYKAQLDILNQWKGKQPVALSSTGKNIPPPTNCESASVISDQVEIDAIIDFLDARKMKARGLERTEMGGVRLKSSGRELASPGFIDALERLVGATQAMERKSQSGQ